LKDTQVSQGWINIGWQVGYGHHKLGDLEGMGVIGVQNPPELLLVGLQHDRLKGVVNTVHLDFLFFNLGSLAVVNLLDRLFFRTRSQLGLESLKGKTEQNDQQYE